MTLSAVATRYANALADVVTASGSALQPPEAVAQLRSFDASLENSAELRNALITPAVPGSRKKAVVGRVADLLALSRITRNFLYVLVDHRRIALLAEIIQVFERIVDERLGYAQALVYSAQALTDPQRAAVTTQFEKLTGKRIRTRFSVDESLIGGIVAHIGSTVYDGSVRGQLATLERRLEAES
jgi:F-type H+-transporting ATPase subunit delta